MPSQVDESGIARAVLERVDDDMIVIAIPATDYQLHLVPTVAADQITTQPGKRIKGTIQAQALRMHAAAGGGRFIEPIYGAPRIVAGAVRVVDTDADRLLVDVSVPVWVTMHDGQTADEFAVGQLVNFYVESGTSFTPIEG